MDDQTDSPTAHNNAPGSPKGIRWWPAGLVLVGSAVVLAFIWLIKDVPRQSKNLESMVVILATIAMLLVWILLFSRMRWKSRFLALGCVAGLAAAIAVCFEITGVSGDLVPIVAWRWRTVESLPDLAPAGTSSSSVSSNNATSDEFAALPAFPQFRGQNRDSILSGPALDRDWEKNPPKELWRRKVGKGLSGFATFAQYAITLEQRAKQEVIACYHLLTGEPI